MILQQVVDVIVIVGSGRKVRLKGKGLDNDFPIEAGLSCWRMIFRLHRDPQIRRVGLSSSLSHSCDNFFDGVFRIDDLHNLELDSATYILVGIKATDLQFVLSRREMGEVQSAEGKEPGARGGLFGT